MTSLKKLLPSLALGIAAIPAFAEIGRAHV